MANYDNLKKMISKQEEKYISLAIKYKKILYLEYSKSNG